MIGIVGGVGPYAGLDLLKKIFDNTRAKKDQDHLDTLLYSLPSGIADRTEYLLGQTEQNPGKAIGKILASLAESGATVAGIPCNTAHAPEIFEEIRSEIRRRGIDLILLNMIEQTILHLKKKHPSVKKVGILSTTGTYKSGIYFEALKAADYLPLRPTEEMQLNLIHPAIYDSEYGIKSVSDPVHPQARRNLLQGIEYLKQRGAEAIILGCTEIPLAFPEKELQGLLLLDPTTVLARALINTIDPAKLES